MVINKNYQKNRIVFAVVALILALTAVPVVGFAGLDEGVLGGKRGPAADGVENILLAQMVEAGDSGDAAVVQVEPMNSEILKVIAEEGDRGEAIITINASNPIQYTAFRLMNPLRLVLDFPKMRQGSLTDRIEVNKGVVDSIRALQFEEAGVLRLEIALNKAAGYNIQKPLKNQLVVSLKETRTPETAAGKMQPPAPASPRGAVDANVEISKAELAEATVDPCEPLLGGEKDVISLDFQDANIRNLFRIFSEISGFNLILSPEVDGRVNMRLMDVPWNEAFEVILSNNRLGRQCLGENIIRVVSLQTLAEEENAKVAENNRKREKEVSEALSAELVTEIVRVNYGDIQDVAKSLETLKTERGKITVDVRTNTLIVTDIQSYVDDMTKLVKVLDIRTPQIMIEAKIVEVNKNVSQQLGVQWGATGSFFNKNTTIGGTNSIAATNGTDTIAATVAVADPFLVDLLPGGGGLLSGASSGFLLGLGGLSSGLDLDVRLTALEKKGDVRILASPRITTLDNKEARIESGRSIPFQTSSAEQGDQTEFVDVELSLTVVPHVTSTDDVYMVIDATKNAANIAVLVAGFPEITTKEAHTEVLVKNGDTTVLGGVFESEVKRNKESVPFFSKIPFLGALFRNLDESDVINELLIFVTPTILSNEYSKKL